jgi:hypothetical protein
VNTFVITRAAMEIDGYFRDEKTALAQDALNPPARMVESMTDQGHERVISGAAC